MSGFGLELVKARARMLDDEAKRLLVAFDENPDVQVYVGSYYDGGPVCVQLRLDDEFLCDCALDALPETRLPSRVKQ